MSGEREFASELMWHGFLDRAEARVRERDAATRADERLKLLRLDEPWSLPEIVRRLSEAADHLLDDHACDRHGHEGVREAAKAGREWLRALVVAATSGSGCGRCTRGYVRCPDPECATCADDRDWECPNATLCGCMTRCPARESGGARCELQAGHAGGHAYQRAAGRTG